MRKVFWDDPYQSRLETQIESVSNDQILLKETIAFSGGQESDMAWINDLSVPKPMYNNEGEYLVEYKHPKILEA